LRWTRRIPHPSLRFALLHPDGLQAGQLADLAAQHGGEVECRLQERVAVLDHLAALAVERQHGPTWRP
jgi:hypothetical protein